MPPLHQRFARSEPWAATPNLSRERGGKHHAETEDTFHQYASLAYLTSRPGGGSDVARPISMP